MTGVRSALRQKGFLTLIMATAVCISCSSERSQSVSHESVITAYFSGLTGGEIDQIPLAESVEFHGPFFPDPIVGQDGVSSFLTQVSAGIADLEIEAHYYSDHGACTQFKLYRRDGVILDIADCFQIEGSEIYRIKAYYDPRELIEALSNPDE